MAQLKPYLTFKGNCREAMTFYKECLGGELKMQTVGESPVAAQIPKEMHKNILHSVLKKDGFTLMASDMMGAGDLVQGNTVTLALICKNKEELEACFSRLSAGGKVGHALRKEFFGTIGDLVDKFGFRWMCVLDETMVT
ncbi:MAG: VOC family protein [Chitinispirillaceae bacterium]|jgi:PhnB protein